MTVVQTTKCDACNSTIPLYSGAHVQLQEHGPVVARKFPNNAILNTDLCDNCWQPIGNHLKDLLESK